EVPDVQQILLAARDQFAHGVDALALEAVVGPDGEVKVLDRQRQVGRQRGVRRRRADVDTLSVHVELARQAKQPRQPLAALATASRGRMHGLVSTSRMSRSKSVRCSTRVASTL